ncbi:hypothetical protein DFH06DRAFT_1363364 [Mycena polygramma]|nr:hypothetical protein DFH06DRAFT_1363364 [Mycena polygramma]
MFRTLLTPLRLRFDSSPRSAVTNPVATPSIPDEEELDPEDFARDVLIELMRISVDKLKLAESTRDRIEVLAEIQRIMTQDALGATKDVFREMDGFVGLMSALSTAEADGSDDTKECSRLAFVITSDAITDHAENAQYFKTRVGYSSLATAIHALVSEPASKAHTLSLLLSFTFLNFTLLNAFSSPDTLLALLPRLGPIKRPGAFALLTRFASYDDDPAMRHAVLKLYEHLASTTHRNHVVLSSPALALAPVLLARFTSPASEDVTDRERAVLQKLLRRLLDMGATPAVARSLFQRVVKDGETLDAELLEVIRYAMKSRWLEHFSMESPASLTLSEEGVRGLPVGGFTYGSGSATPPTTAHTLFSARLPSNNANNANPHRAIITLALRPDGKLELSSSANREVGVFRKSGVQRQRWTHVALVHYAGRGVNPSVRLYVDGVLNDGLNWAYPKFESSPQTVKYVLGDDSGKTRMSWCVASAHLMGVPFGDDLPRFIHHLGPRYSGNFQDPLLVKFLTYEASTSLNMYLSTVVSSSSYSSSNSSSSRSSTNSSSSHPSSNGYNGNAAYNAYNPKSPKSPHPNGAGAGLGAGAGAPLMKVVRDGLGIAEGGIVFSVSPLSVKEGEGGEVGEVPANGNVGGGNGGSFVVGGDVFVVEAACAQGGDRHERAHEDRKHRCQQAPSSRPNSAVQDAPQIVAPLSNPPHAGSSTSTHLAFMPLRPTFISEHETRALAAKAARAEAQHRDESIPAHLRAVFRPGVATQRRDGGPKVLKNDFAFARSRASYGIVPKWTTHPSVPIGKLAFVLGI